MQTNLNVDTFRNGDLIPHAKTKEEWKLASINKQPAWCYLMNDPLNELKTGRLYNWFAVNDSRKITPEGLHIPSDEEWSELVSILGGEESAGLKMKTINNWQGTNAGATNESQFSAIPGGYRTDGGTFFGDDLSCGRWWSSSQNNDTEIWGRFLTARYGLIERRSANKGNGLNVRCIFDN